MNGGNGIFIQYSTVVEIHVHQQKRSQWKVIYSKIVTVIVFVLSSAIFSKRYLRHYRMDAGWRKIDAATEELQRRRR